jgi:hypothetical protein
MAGVGSWYRESGEVRVYLQVADGDLITGSEQCPGCDEKVGARVLSQTRR